MTSAGDQGHPGGGDPGPRRPDLPHPQPPSIRVTGDVPGPGLGPGRRPGGFPGLAEPLRVPHFPEAAPPGTAESGSAETFPPGSVIDRPAPAPPDWMSGVEVPELVTDPGPDGEGGTGGGWIQPEQSRIPSSIQRGVSMALVVVLVIAIVLVLLGSITDLGAGLG